MQNITYKLNIYILHLGLLTSDTLVPIWLFYWLYHNKQTVYSCLNIAFSFQCLFLILKTKGQNHNHLNISCISFSCFIHYELVIYFNGNLCLKNTNPSIYPLFYRQGFGWGRQNVQWQPSIFCMITSFSRH